MDTRNLYINPKNVFEFNYKKLPKVFSVILVIVFLWWLFNAFFVLENWTAGLKYLADHWHQMLFTSMIVGICICFKKNKLLKKECTSYIENYLISNQSDPVLLNTLLALNKHNNRYIAADLQSIQVALIKQKKLITNNDLKHSLLADNKIAIDDGYLFNHSIDIKTLELNIKRIHQVIK
ncbi:hypothetical protein [Acinetobacter baumannii]|uniref:hypothetical protein n=2 Tax=Acinetobacter baumannii TaxID=470 RepID=UPI0023425A3E|nr:hypothetical protein [Acinetobacter baumannii]MDC4147561.1 hypothetical protein [Acinetobacter baumannii]